MTEFSEVFPGTQEHVQSAFEITNRLKNAALSLQGDPSWVSLDGASSYMARPLRFRDGDELSDGVEIPYAHLGNISEFVRDSILNAWSINAIIRPSVDASSEIGVQRYLFDENAVLMSQHIVSPVMFENSVQGEFLRNMFDEEQRHIPMQAASVRDLANLQNALVDLEAIVQADKIERENRIEAMSKQELREIRTQERQAHRFREEREVESLEHDGPAWWKIEYGYGYGGMRVYSILADSAEDAVLDLEDYFNMKTLIIEEFGSAYNVKPYDDASQAELSRRYDGKNFVRVFPFSLVEMGHNLDNATDEQRAAHDIAVAILGDGAVFG